MGALQEGSVLSVEVMARREDWSEGVSLYVRQRTVGQGTQVAAPMTMVPHQRGTAVEPLLRLQIQQAQELMDELWRCGLRPSEGAGSAGSLAATERHLRDMQTIAFELLRKDGEPFGALACAQPT